MLTRNWIVAAFVVHLIAAWFSVGHYHDDEYHQILAFAAARLDMPMQAGLNWEYAAKIRSGFQPFLVYFLVKTVTPLGITSPFVWAFLLRLFSAVLSIFASVLFLRAIIPELKVQRIQKWTVFFFLFFWMHVFLNVRYSSEGWSSSLFILGIGLYLHAARLSPTRYYIIGLIFGFAFLARYQTGLMLLGLGLWMIFIQHINAKQLTRVLAGGILALAFGAAFDWWLYGVPTSSAWNYFNANLIEGGLAKFGHEPWWFYIKYSALQLLPPITLFLPISVVTFWVLFPRHPITWATVPFVIFHHIVGHKEMRFLLPVLPFAPIMLAFVLEEIIKTTRLSRIKIVRRLWQILFNVSLALNIPLLILILFVPASREVALWEKCISHMQVDKQTTMLSRDAGELNLDFYNLHGFKIIKVESEINITELSLQHPNSKIFYAARKRDYVLTLQRTGLSHKLVCQIVPNWVLALNINNWTSRASLWRIWEIGGETDENR